MKTLKTFNQPRRHITCSTTLTLLTVFLIPMCADARTKFESTCPPRGLEIPAELPYKRMGKIPGWERYGISGGLRDIGNTFYGQDMVTRSGVDCEVFYFARQDRSRVIKDSIDITNVYRNPGPPSTERSYCYVLRPDGSFDPQSEDQIVGFTLPEKGREGCNHYSRRVRGAWRIDFDAGRYLPVSAKQLICDRPEAGDGCYDCKRPKAGHPCIHR